MLFELHWKIFCSTVKSDFFFRMTYDKQTEFYIDMTMSMGNNCVSFSYLLDDETKVAIVRENLETIRSKFAKLTVNVCKCLREMKLDVTMVRLYLRGLFQPGDCIPKSEKLDEIFDAITANGLWNYSHFGPVEKVIQEYAEGDAELNGHVEEYKKALTGFYLTTKIVDYMKAVNEEEDEDPIILDDPAKYDSRYCRKLSVGLKLKRKITNETLAYVERLWRKIAEEFYLPSLTSILERIVEGSLTITWRVQAHLIAKIDTQSFSSAIFFHQEGIDKITIDNQVVYSEEQALVRICVHCTCALCCLIRVLVCK